MQALAVFLERVRRTDAVRTINRFLNSKYMLIVFAALTLLSNIFELEIFVYALMFLIAVYVILFGKDMLTFAAIAIFMYISPSAENNPFINPDSFFFPGNGIALGLIISLLVAAVLLFGLRVATDFGFVRFLRTERKLNVGFFLLAAAFLLGGVGYAEYDFRNIPYALLLFVAFYMLYFFLTGAVRWREVPKDYFSWLGLIVGLTVVLQLVNVFVIHADYIFSESGGIGDRHFIYTGWGTYTSMSIVLLIAMPCAFYFAAVKKHGFIFNILGSILYLAIVASNCRGSILMGAVVYLCCAVAVLTRKENRKGNLVVYCVVALGAFTVLIVFREKVMQLLSGLFNLALDDSNRFKLFEDGIFRFTQMPVFGEGFYACPTEYWNNQGGATFIPAFWHNTFIQMLAACGVIGLAAYLFHRFQTILLFVRRPSLCKTFIGFSVLSILLTCLLDCHIFNIGVTIIYSIALAFAEKSEEMTTEREDDLLLRLVRKLPFLRSRRFAAEQVLPPAAGSFDRDRDSSFTGNVPSDVSEEKEDISEKKEAASEGKEELSES